MSSQEVTTLRKAGRLTEAYQMAMEDMEKCEDFFSCQSVFWVCVDMLKQPKEVRSGTDGALMYSIRGLMIKMEEYDKEKVTPIIREGYGWSIVRYLWDNYATLVSIESRKLLADYFDQKLPIPSNLHSAILGVAAKMALLHPEFKFVSFLKMWNLHNLRPEDKVAKEGKDGKRIPSLLEQVAKAYAYSLLFHPDLTLDVDDELLLTPIIEAKGYLPVMDMVMTKLHSAEVKGRKMYFAKLVGSDGTELSCEVHKLTEHNKMKYAELSNKLFSILPRLSKDGTMRVDGAILSKQPMEKSFPKCAGYIENIDINHNHIHIYDSLSRHLVCEGGLRNVKVGQYVEFFPIVPKTDKFKSAIINKVYSTSEGRMAFGPKPVRIKYVDKVKGYCTWELIASTLVGDSVEKLSPIVEAGTTEPSYTSGFLSSQTIQAKGIEMPSVGSEMRITVFLKRGKDRVKRPHVVDFF